MNRIWLFLLFLCMSWNARGQSVYEWSYWFDNDERPIHAGSTTNGQLTVSIDGSDLAEGFHTLHVQVADTAGRYSPAISRLFYRADDSSTQRLYFWFDNDDRMQTADLTSGMTQIDVSTLSEGFHVLHCQTGGQVMSVVVSRSFLKIPQADGVGRMQCIYSVDDMPAHVEAGLMANGLFHIDLDVSALANGLHRIAYTMVSDEGTTLPWRSAFFWKTPAGGDGICEYWYWLNEQSEDEATKVTLPEKADPYRLVTLLPVKSMPIRSKLFKFTIEDGAPTLYAQNEIHLRFINNSGRQLDVCRQYTDQNVRRSISGIDVLQPNESRTACSPATDSIVWYQLTALRGDSISFRTDKACTLQLFSPSAKEVYTASGAFSTKYGGVYAPEDGTYYLAIHDVTARDVEKITVSYQHLDKYALLGYTPAELGVLPCVQLVDLEGNGFDYLESATLSNGQMTIAQQDILSNSKTKAQLLFLLSGEEPLGSYDLTLTFNDNGQRETIVRKNAIVLAEPDLGSLDIAFHDVKSISNRPENHIRIQVSNTGNISYINIPFYMAYPTNDVSDIHFNNFSIYTDKRLADAGVPSTYTINNFKNNQSRSPVTMIPAVIPALKGGETRTFHVRFTQSGDIYHSMYTWGGTPWNFNAEDTRKAIRRRAANGTLKARFSNGNVVLPGGNAANGAVDGNLIGTCMPDPCEYVGLVMSKLAECGCATAYNLSSVFANIYAALLNRHHQAMREYMGDYANDYEDLLQMNSLRSPADFLTNMADHCTDGKLNDIVSAYNAIQDMIGQDPCPQPQRAQWQYYRPSDPNDIFGYVSESGSKYMKEGTTDVYYTIEFENDPELANAAAHTIVVKDTLDAARFDLSTFAATGVKIGSVEMELNGEKSFQKRTMDLRPAIDVIAQVSLDYDEQQGIATWTIESLDPMTMEPTEDAMQGVLPVNVNGDGQGDLSFDISLKPGMREGEAVSNRAAIVFDQEEVIMTPTWTNIVDATLPESRVTEASMGTDTTAVVLIEAFDELSKPWKYDLYVKAGEDGTWQRKGADIPVDSVLQVAVEAGVSYGFYVVATDSAGNVERKEAVAEYTLAAGMAKGDVNGDGIVDTQDAIKVIQFYLGRKPENFDERQADMNGDGTTDAQDAIQIIKVYLKKE